MPAASHASRQSATAPYSRSHAASSFLTATWCIPAGPISINRQIGPAQGTRIATQAMEPTTKIARRQRILLDTGWTIGGFPETHRVTQLFGQSHILWPHPQRVGRAHTAAQ